MKSETWTIRLSPAGQRSLDRLPQRYAAAVATFITGTLLENPHRIGRPLRRDLDGQHVARRGAYRVVYVIDDSRRTVTVTRIDHRSDVYRPS